MKNIPVLYHENTIKTIVKCHCAQSNGLSLKRITMPSIDQSVVPLELSSMIIWRVLYWAKHLGKLRLFIRTL